MKFVRSLEKISIFLLGSELISEFLKTCYARVLLVKRPEIDQTVASTDNSFYVDDDQLSTAPSFSSKVTCFSQRLSALNRSKRELKIEEKIQVAVGRGRVIDPNSSHRDHFGHRENLNNEEEIDEKLSNDRISSPVPSVTNTSVFYSFLFSCLKRMNSKSLFFSFFV